MRRFNRFVLVILVASMSLVAWIPQAFAGKDHARHHKEGPVARFERHAEEIGLTDSQLEEIRSLAAAGAGRRDELHSESRAASDELHALMVSDAPDEAAILAFVESIGNLKTEGRVERTRLELAFKKILTPNQREQMREFGGRHHYRHRGKHAGPHAEKRDGSCAHGSSEGGSCEEGSCKHESCSHGKHASVGECPDARAAREIATDDPSH